MLVKLWPPGNSPQNSPYISQSRSKLRTHTQRHTTTYTWSNNPSTWSSRERMGAGRSYINLSELVKDKQKHTDTQLRTQRNVMSSLWNDKQGYMVRQTNRQIRWMGRWSITDIQTYNKTGSCGTLVWQISSVRCSDSLIVIQSLWGLSNTKIELHALQ